MWRVIEILTGNGLAYTSVSAAAINKQKDSHIGCVVLEELSSRNKVALIDKYVDVNRLVSKYKGSKNIKTIELEIFNQRTFISAISKLMPCVYDLMGYDSNTNLLGVISNRGLYLLRTLYVGRSVPYGLQNTRYIIKALNGWIYRVQESKTQASKLLTLEQLLNPKWLNKYYTIQEDNKLVVGTHIKGSKCNSGFYQIVNVPTFRSIVGI